MAFRMMNDERIDVKGRQSWLKSYTDAARTLAQFLTAREAKDWETRVRLIEQYKKKTRSAPIQPLSTLDKQNDTPRKQDTGP